MAVCGETLVMVGAAYENLNAFETADATYTNTSRFAPSPGCNVHTICDDVCDTAGQLAPPTVTTPLDPKFKPANVSATLPAVEAVDGEMDTKEGPVYENEADDDDNCDLTDT